MTNQYEKWQLIHWLKDFAEELGKSPTRNELDNEPSMPSADVFSSRFGSHNEALKKAGLELNYKYYTKEELLNKLKEFADKLCRAPKKCEIMRNKNMPNKMTYKRRFGSYRNACKKIGYEYKTHNKNHGYSKQKLLKMLRKFAFELGRTPTTIEVNDKKGIPCSGTYTYHFDSYSKACEKAGLVPWERGMKFDHLSEEEFQKRVVPSEKEKVS